MVIFFTVLALGSTLGLCWLLDREHIVGYTAAALFLELCNYFWLILPQV